MNIAKVWLMNGFDMGGDGSQRIRREVGRVPEGNGLFRELMFFGENAVSGGNVSLGTFLLRKLS